MVRVDVSKYSFNVICNIRRCKRYIKLTDFGSNAFVRFDPLKETSTVIKIPSQEAEVRQILGITGGIFGAESGRDKIVSIKSG